MHGTQPSLRDLLQGQQPEVVSLHCDEELDYEVEDQEQVMPHLFEVPCPRCDTVVTFAVECSREALRQLQELIIAELICPCPNC